MEYILICIVALLGSGLTLFSGFGLGTLLIPIFGFFFPIEIAIFLTAIVHFLNNIFKLILLGKNANKQILIYFGIPAIVFAMLGAYTLSLITDLSPLGSYVLGGKTFYIVPIKLGIGLILLFFSLFEVIPSWSEITFDKKFMPLGGALSGFFGGLSGLQGALRSAFLLRAGLTKEAFISTGIVIACVIDVLRMSVYTQHIASEAIKIDYTLIMCATLSAFIGAFWGNRLLGKVTLKTIQMLIAFLLMLFAVFLIFGIL
ncbi:TSUP family transporter [Flavobacterium sp. TSSA_36]|uniref:TSUP family transporter n=1 Tax=Flavobacterium sp. TSSA_36 TaxID=3447669 RepID=UPI003F2B8D51